jgi:hypothetical protein
MSSLIYSELKRQVMDLMTLDDPLTEQFDDRVRDAARAALSEIEPTAVQQSTFTTQVFEDRTTGTTEVYLEATADPRVLMFTDVAGVSETLPWTPPVNGTWDRIMNLALTVIIMSSGIVISTTEYRALAWEFFSLETGVAEGDPPNTIRYYVSLDRPWHNTSDTGITFRIYQNTVWTPNWTNGLTGAMPGRIYGTGEQNILLGTQEQLKPTKRESGQGVPRLIARNGQYALPPLRRAVIATADDNTPWNGPEQEGQWQFYATIVGGRQDRRYNIGGTEIVDPVFESAPTPISLEFDHTNHGGGSIILTAPNPDQMLNFDTATLRKGHSGLRVRFYVACNGLIASGAGTRNDVSADNIPYLLVEVDPEPSAMDVSFTWSGESLDRMRTMFASGEQFGYELYPRPDDDYVIDWQVMKRMPALWSEYDPMPIKPEALNAFLYLWAANLGPKVGIGLDIAEQWRAASRPHMRKALAVDADNGIIRSHGYGMLGGDPIAQSYRKIRPVTY